MSGFVPVSWTTAVPLGLSVEQNVTMLVAGVAEAIDVVAETPGPIATPVVGANFGREEIEALATPRTLQGIAQLAPALTENAPNSNQVVINGAFAFDNAFMINGVDVNDNLFAQPKDLFIEDAIEETQVLTSGISAEYGRFTGGVINAVTKSGGNLFSGSFRTNFSNPAWTDETPFEKSNDIERSSELLDTYEVTLGGPLVRDRLWFFGAGRWAVTEAFNTLPQTAVQYVQNRSDKRGEIKITATPVAAQTVQVGYLKHASTNTNDSGILSLIVDPAALVTRRRPNRYVFTNYRGVLGDQVLAEAQYAARWFELVGGGTITSIVDSPFVVPSIFGVYNAPYFDESDPDERNNRQLTGSLTSFWRGVGRHETKIGYEFYRSQVVGGNSQSATGYTIWSDFATDADGAPLFDAAGRLMPVFVPGASFIEAYPELVRGATLNNDANSIYAQDHWVVNGHVSADLGFRFERVKSVATGNVIGVDNNRIVPRLAVAYDPFGTGDQVVHVTYGQYSGRYNEAQIGGNSPVGNPGFVDAFYVGPPGQGLDFAAGLDVDNYPIAPGNAFAVLPGTNVFMDPDLKSALVHEFTTSYGESLANGRGYAEVAYVYRKTTSMIEDFSTVADGFTDAGDLGVITNQVFRNGDESRREYQGLVIQSRYRVADSWTLNGHWTVQLKNDGNFEGEATNRPAQTSIIGNYPEAFSAARNYPDGRLQSFQRHRLRIWSIHTLPLGRYGNASVSGLWRVDSARVFSLRALRQSLTPTQRAIIVEAGYPDAPGRSGNDVYFGERGSERFKGYGLFDLSLGYNVGVFETVRPWIKFDVFNVFNNNKLISWSTTVVQDDSSQTDSLGLATGYVRSPTFGEAERPENFPVPFNGATGGRTRRVAVGLRF